MLNLENVKSLFVSLKELDTEYFNDVIIIPDSFCGYKIIDVFSGNVFYLRVGGGDLIFMAVDKTKPNKKKIKKFHKKKRYNEPWKNNPKIKIK